VFRWPADGLIERVNERIKKQIEKVEEMTGDMDAKTNFSLIVIQTELERWKYLARGYLRARIAKVREILSQVYISLKIPLENMLILLSSDRQTHPTLPLHAGNALPAVCPGDSLRNAAPSPLTRPLQLLIPVILPGLAAESRRHGRWHKHD
jgi:hypothetical protein